MSDEDSSDVDSFGNEDVYYANDFESEEESESDEESYLAFIVDDEEDEEDESDVIYDQEEEGEENVVVTVASTSSMPVPIKTSVVSLRVKTNNEKVSEKVSEKVEVSETFMGIDLDKLAISEGRSGYSGNELKEFIKEINLRLSESGQKKLTTSGAKSVLANRITEFIVNNRSDDYDISPKDNSGASTGKLAVTNARPISTGSTFSRATPSMNIAVRLVPESLDTILKRDQGEQDSVYECRVKHATEMFNSGITDMGEIDGVSRANAQMAINSVNYVA